MNITPPALEDLRGLEDFHHLASNDASTRTLRLKVLEY